MISEEKRWSNRPSGWSGTCDFTTESRRHGEKIELSFRGAQRRGICIVGQFPSFRVFPRDVDRMIQVQEQPFAAVKEAETKKIVVNERCKGAENDVDEAEAAMPFGDRQVGSEGGVVVHVIEVVGEGRVAVVN